MGVSLIESLFRVGHVASRDENHPPVSKLLEDDEYPSPGIRASEQCVAIIARFPDMSSGSEAGFFDFFRRKPMLALDLLGDFPNPDDLGEPHRRSPDSIYGVATIIKPSLPCQ
jgi:hypothetical protein